MIATPHAPASTVPRLGARDVATFAADGYLVVRGLLDPTRDTRPVATAYTALIDALAAIYRGELRAARRRRIADVGAHDLGTRLATLLGMSGGEALYHLAPVLTVLSPAFRWRRDLPSAQLSELFALSTNDALLDCVEALIGPEIAASPIYHLNLKLAPSHLALADDIARAARRRSPARVIHYGLEVGATPWHMDAAASLPDAHASAIVVAWIPLTAADAERGALRIVPRSHLGDVHVARVDDVTAARAVTIDAAPGDVVFMDNKLVHGATANRSARDVRWACNLRYLPIGQANGRPYLPGFVARSRAASDRALRDPRLWAAMWRGALAAAARDHARVPQPATTTLENARTITAAWRTAAPDDRAWLTLGSRCARPSRRRAPARALHAIRRFVGSRLRAR